MTHTFIKDITPRRKSHEDRGKRLMSHSGETPETTRNWKKQVMILPLTFKGKVVLSIP
jgi:hypothetical protein